MTIIFAVLGAVIAIPLMTYFNYTELDYCVNKTESCINRIVFFPFYYHSLQGLGDAGLILLPFIVLYGGLVGILIGGITSLVIYIIRHLNKNENK